MRKVNLREKFSLIQDHWVPRITAEVNDIQLKIVKIQGEFDWHHHDKEDELFFVWRGRLLLQFRDREIWLESGEMLTVPRGTEHRPVAPEEVELVLIEPKGIKDRGNIETELPPFTLEWI